MKEQIWQEAYDKLKQEHKELTDKLNHIKIVGFGNAHTIEKQLKEYFEKSTTVSFEDVISIMWEEVEKTDNLCLMCDGINMYVKYEATLRELENKLADIRYYSHTDSYAYKKIPNLIESIKNALNTPIAEEAIKKAHSEFEKYDNKTSL